VKTPKSVGPRSRRPSEQTIETPFTVRLNEFSINAAKTNVESTGLDDFRYVKSLAVSANQNRNRVGCRRYHNDSPSGLGVADRAVFFFEVFWQQAVDLQQALASQRDLVAVDGQEARLLLIAEGF